MSMKTGVFCFVPCAIQLGVFTLPFKYILGPEVLFHIPIAVALRRRAAARDGSLVLPPDFLS